LVFGIDLAGLADVQDIVMIEDYGLVRWGRDEVSGEEVLLNNALTIRTARALVGDTPISVDPYDRGIGFDGVYSPRRFVQGIAEAAACGAHMVVKGTEFVEDGEFTLLTAERFGLQRQAIGSMHRWIMENAKLFSGRVNKASIGLLHPGDALWQRWDQLAPLFFGCAQTLLAAGTPWRVVSEADDRTGLELLVCFDSVRDRGDISSGLRVLDVTDLPCWELPPESLLARNRWLRDFIAGWLGWGFQGYFRWNWMRRLVDGLNLVNRFWQTGMYRLPVDTQRRTLLEAVGQTAGPVVDAEMPVLVEWWQRGELDQLALVNYGADRQPAGITYPERVHGRVISPGSSYDFTGDSLHLELDVLALVETRRTSPVAS
jgi:hypothetical protein